MNCKKKKQLDKEQKRASSRGQDKVKEKKNS